MPDPIVIDAAGNTRSLDWLRSKYGPFVIYDPPPCCEEHSDAATPAQTWRITALCEKCNAPAALVVKTLGLDGAPMPGVKVAWYWPDAPADAEAGPAGAPFEGVTPGRAVAGYANGEGDTGFAMGGGAYYNPEIGERGPHAAWIHGTDTRSQLILGLGMYIGTNHDHFDVEYTLVDDSGEEPEEPETEFLALMQNIVSVLNRIADAIEQPYTITLRKEDPTNG